MHIAKTHELIWHVYVRLMSNQCQSQVVWYLGNKCHQKVLSLLSAVICGCSLKCVNLKQIYVLIHQASLMTLVLVNVNGSIIWSYIHQNIWYMSMIYISDIWHHYNTTRWYTKQSILTKICYFCCKQYHCQAMVSHAMNSHSLMHSHEKPWCPFEPCWVGWQLLNPLWPRDAI